MFLSVDACASAADARRPPPQTAPTAHLRACCMKNPLVLLGDRCSSTDDRGGFVSSKARTVSQSAPHVNHLDQPIGSSMLASPRARASLDAGLRRGSFLSRIAAPAHPFARRLKGSASPASRQCVQRQDQLLEFAHPQRVARYMPRRANQHRAVGLFAARLGQPPMAAAHHRGIQTDHVHVIAEA